MPQVEDRFDTQLSKTEPDKTCVKRQCLLWNLKEKVGAREEARVGVGVLVAGECFLGVFQTFDSRLNPCTELVPGNVSIVRARAYNSST